MEAATAPTASGLTDEQQDFVAAIRDFAEREKFDGSGEDHHSDELAAKMAELGWWGLQIPDEYGGSGGGLFDACLFLEETARGQIPIGAYGVTLIVVGALNRFGTEEQKQELLGAVSKGGVLAIAMSEPDSGSDVASLKTKARLEDGEWVLSGAKMWCSYAHKASHTLIVCRTGEGSEKHEGLSMIFVPHDAEGFTITPIKTHGRGGDQRAPPRRRARARERPARHRGQRLDPADGRPELRAHDPRGDSSAWRSARSTTRSPT